jgi:hypothetical protein
MQAFNKELNTVALDVSLEALFGTKGRDDAKRVYELLNSTMVTAHAAGLAEKDAEMKLAAEDYVAALVRAEDSAARHIAAAFRNGMRYNAAEAEQVTPCEETAFIREAASALG